jgi:hypothetical protein
MVAFMSMMGSGIYSVTATREMVCKEMSIDNEGCSKVWSEDFQTDDWGNIDEKVICPQCKNEFYYTEK